MIVIFMTPMWCFLKVLMINGGNLQWHLNLFMAILIMMMDTY